MVSEECCLRLQQDPDQLGKWAKEWQMEFDLVKYEVRQFGRLNQGRMYIVNDRTLASMVHLRFQREHVYNSLKMAI